MAHDRMLTLHFIDGTKISFDFPEQTTHAASRQFKLEEFLKGHHLLIEADGCFLIFPIANIKYLQLALAEASIGTKINLPGHMIRGATITS